MIVSNCFYLDKQQLSLEKKNFLNSNLTVIIDHLLLLENHHIHIVIFRPQMRIFDQIYQHFLCVFLHQQNKILIAINYNPFEVHIAFEVKVIMCF